MTGRRTWLQGSLFFLWLLFLSFFGGDVPLLGQQAPAVLSGSWMASVGGERYLRGSWSAEISSGNPNSARGSWTLLSDSGDIVMQGTWSARKTAGGWQGTWTATVSKGGALSGSWSADLAGFAGKTMEEMLRRTDEKQVAGSWQSGRYRGYWWLDGSRAKRK